MYDISERGKNWKVRECINEKKQSENNHYENVINRRVKNYSQS